MNTLFHTNTQEQQRMTQSMVMNMKCTIFFSWHFIFTCARGHVLHTYASAYKCDAHMRTTRMRLCQMHTFLNTRATTMLSTTEMVTQKYCTHQWLNGRRVSLYRFPISVTQKLKIKQMCMIYICRNLTLGQASGKELKLSGSKHNCAKLQRCKVHAWNIGFFRIRLQIHWLTSAWMFHKNI